MSTLPLEFVETSYVVIFNRGVLPVCVIHKCKCIMHSAIRWLTLKQYVFCKDNRLVLIVECLFAKANTANAGAELLKLRPLLREQQLPYIKATYSKSERLVS